MGLETHIDLMFMKKCFILPFNKHCNDIVTKFAVSITEVQERLLHSYLT